MASTQSEIPTILVLQVRGLNAFLAAVPALRAIADAFPDCRRILVAPGGLRALVGLIPWPGFSPAFDVVSHPALVPLPRSLERPNLAINLHGPGPQSNSVLRALEPRRLVAYEAPRWQRGPEWEPEASEVSRWCALLADAGIAVDRSRTRIWKPQSHEFARDATVLHPGGDGDVRSALHIPASAWADVARSEAAAGRTVLITGRDRDAISAAAIAERAGLDDAAVVAGRTDVGDLARIVSGAARVVTVDGGIAPLAAALGTPSLTAYHPRVQSRLGTPRTGHRHRALLLDAEAPGNGAGPSGNGAGPGVAGGEIAELLIAEMQRIPERRFDRANATPEPAPAAVPAADRAL
ncbi:MAG TPA: glycosyltransferase family 9 protein [Solirubrobacterales bacterium]